MIAFCCASATEYSLHTHTKKKWVKTNTYSHKFSFRLEITLVKLYLPTEDFQKRNDATENGPRELALLQAGFLLYIGSGIIAVGVKLRCDATIRNFKTQCSTVYHGKYRGWNGSTVEISCWSDLAQPSGWNKKQPKKLVQPCHFHCFL